MAKLGIFRFKYNQQCSNYKCLSIAVLPINKARTKALNRIGPHNKKILDIIISGMLGDFGADKYQVTN